MLDCIYSLNEKPSKFVNVSFSIAENMVAIMHQIIYMNERSVMETDAGFNRRIFNFISFLFTLNFYDSNSK